MSFEKDSYILLGTKQKTEIFIMKIKRRTKIKQFSALSV